MPVFGVRLSDDLARRFDQSAAKAGGRAALMRKLIEQAADGPGEGSDAPSPASRRPHRLEIRLDNEDMRLLAAASSERGLTRNGWAAELVRHRLRASAPPALPERQAIADAWRQIRRVGLNINQAVHALHAAMMKDSRLDLAREAARVADMRQDVADQTRALGRALKGDLSYWQGEGDGDE